MLYTVTNTHMKFTFLKSFHNFYIIVLPLFIYQNEIRVADPLIPLTNLRNYVFESRVDYFITSSFRA